MKCDVCNTPGDESQVGQNLYRLPLHVMGSEELVVCGSCRRTIIEFIHQLQAAALRAAKASKQRRESGNIIDKTINNLRGEAK